MCLCKSSKLALCTNLMASTTPHLPFTLCKMRDPLPSKESLCEIIILPPTISKYSKLVCNWILIIAFPRKLEKLSVPVNFLPNEIFTMWLSILLEFVRQTKLFKLRSKLSPDTSLLGSFCFPFFFSFFFLLIFWICWHQHRMPYTGIFIITLVWPSQAYA